MLEHYNGNKVERQSNLELLRLVAMLMVLILHGGALVNGLPTYQEIHTDVLSSVFRFIFQNASLVAVDVFVLISGWFGLSFKWKSIVNILFQCVFWGITFAVLTYIFSPECFTIKKTLNTLYFGSNYWFVPSYIGLMILSPVLNAFVKNSSKIVFKQVIVVFFLFQFIYNWLWIDDCVHFAAGYSLLSFVGIYLIARYVRLYPPSFSTHSCIFDILFYIFLVLFSSLCEITIKLFNNDVIDAMVSWRFEAYNSPLVIISSVFLFLAFTKLNIGRCKWINWLASSSFAIYLIHQNVYVFDFYKSSMRYLFISYSGFLYLVYFIMTVFGVGLSSILFDKFRCYIQNLFVSKYKN